MVTKKGNKWIMRGSIRLSDGSLKNYNKIIKDESVKRKEQAKLYELNFRNSYNHEYFEAQSSFLTLGEFIEIYKNDKANETKYNTKKNVEFFSNRLSTLHNYKINLITTSDLKKVIDEYYKKHSVSGANTFLKIVKKIFNHAVKKDIILSNPANKIALYKKVDEIKKEMDFYTPQEWQILEPYLKETGIIYYTFFQLLYYTGMRKGEARALTFNDLNMDKRTIRINKALINKYTEKQNWAITSPKTENSNRTILMPQKLYDILSIYLSYINDKDKSAFLFGIDKPLSETTIKKKFNKSTESAGLRHIRIHDLRHSHASMLINNGALDKAVADRLGNTVNMVRSTYSHLFLETEKELINIIDNIK